MKRIFFCALSVSMALYQSAVAQPAYSGVMAIPPPPPGYGTGAPPAGYGTTSSVPAYPNALPPSSVSPNVTSPPAYDQYAAAPQPGQVSSVAPQGVSNYGSQPAYGTNGGGSNMINFRYAEVYYRYLAPKHSDLAGASTIGGALSLELSSLFYLKFGASWGSGTDSGGSVGSAAHAKYQFASVQAGAGFHTQLTSRVTFVAEAGMVYASLKAKDSAVSFSDGSVYIRPGLRYTPRDWLELQAGVTVSSADKYDSKILDFTSYFRVMPQFDLGVGGDFGNTTRAFRATMRLRW